MSRTFVTNPTQVFKHAYPQEQGEVTYVSGSFWFLQASGLTPLTSASLMSASHAAIHQLVHLADGVGGPFEEFATGAVRDMGPIPFMTASIWYTSAARTNKIVEKLIVYNPNKTPATTQWKVYGSDGSTVLVTVTDTITYSSVFETSRTRTIT